MKNQNVSYILCSTIVLVCYLSSSKVDAWGGLFNRFNPSMLSDLGYGNGGGGYGKELYSAAHSGPASNKIEDVLDEESSAGTGSLDGCAGKMCTANEHCCDKHVCVDADETTGTCMPSWGKKQGEHCYNDQDCESGFLCMGTGARRTCQSPNPGDKILGEECRTSSECNGSKGLCCKLIRRARSQPKKLCSYYVDPQNCLGPVAASPVAGSREFTAGEKRLEQVILTSYILIRSK